MRPPTIFFRFKIWLWDKGFRINDCRGYDLCWGLTSQSTIFQSYRDGAIASWVINQYFRGVKCLAQGHNTAAVGLEPRTSRSGVRHSTTEPPRSPCRGYEPEHDKTNKMTCVPSEDSDQPVHPPGLIRVFAVPLNQTYFRRTSKTDQTEWMPRMIWVFAGRTYHFVDFVMLWLILFLFIIHRLKISLRDIPKLEQEAEAARWR